MNKISWSHENSAKGVWKYATREYWLTCLESGQQMCVAVLVCGRITWCGPRLKWTKKHFMFSLISIFIGLIGVKPDKWHMGDNVARCVFARKSFWRFSHADINATNSFLLGESDICNLCRRTVYKVSFRTASFSLSERAFPPNFYAA